jgi:hypothetical protein
MKQEIPLITNPWNLGRPWSDDKGISEIFSIRHESYRERRKWLKDREYPFFLYKFKAADERCMSHLEDIVIHSKLYLSSPKQFNDPFDMAAEITAIGSLNDLLVRIDDSPAVPESDKQSKKDEVRQIVENIGVKGYFQNGPNVFRDTLDKTGVFSFTTTKVNDRSSGPRNVLMWSHYGDSHSGVCLQFEIAQELSLLRELVRVQYHHEFPRVNWLSRTYESDLFKVLSNKDVCWGYEHEWRFILHECANTYLSISPHALTSIIVGCKMKDEKLRAILEMLAKRKSSGKPPVKLFKTTMSKQKYELRVTRTHQKYIS